MRLITCLALSIFMLACSSSKHSGGSNGLTGVWKPVKQEFGGKAFPLSQYENYRLTMTDTSYTYSPSASFIEDRGSLHIKNGKMDIYGREGVNAGKHFMAIYKLDNGELTICYNLRGDSYPAAFETTSQPSLFLSVYKKEK